jgi:hypothetical protein
LERVALHEHVGEPARFDLSKALLWRPFSEDNNGASGTISIWTAPGAHKVTRVKSLDYDRQGR